MTRIPEILYYFFYFIIGLLLGSIIILELIEGVVDGETWDKINNTDALPNEFKRRLSVLTSSFNQGERIP